VRFTVDAELELFAGSVRGALTGWEGPVDVSFGDWWDERDDALAGRLARVGWVELWAGETELLAAVAGGIELGRATAPLCLVDEATLGAPLSTGGRVRHGAGRETWAVARPGGGLVLAAGRGAPEATLDGTGTLSRLELGAGTPVEDAAARWRAWGVATLAYHAGLAAGALATAVEHVRAREQFGAPLAALPAVQQRLADAALAADALVLTAWRAAAHEDAGAPLPVPSLLWAGCACRDVTAAVHQVHGATGFALEAGVHRAYRRAKTVQVWTASACAELSGNRKGLDGIADEEAGLGPAGDHPDASAERDHA
jgi:hypothetical protein